ncbi:MAG: dehydrogenase [Marinilabiliales bacterium]|nr:MAG: dehydrogenase [Marinilabiliales bacterium]
MKTILITGSTDGIGKQTALDLALKGHEIIVHGRNELRGKSIAEEIISQSGNENIHYINADFSKFGEVKDLAQKITNNHTKLDVLINNAGVFENEKHILPNGFEKTFMINHLAPFVLTNLLLDFLVETENSRIVNVASMAQASSIDFKNMNAEKYFDAYNAYAVSKLANILFTYKLADLISHTNTTVNCLHPGVISTKLLQNGWGMGGASLEQGARTSVYLADSEQVEGVSSKYYVDSMERKSVAISYDKKVQNRLWEISENIMNTNIN